MTRSILLLLLAASTAPNLADFGTTAVTQKGRENAEAQHRFFAAYKAGKPGRWQVLGGTAEGDPIYYRLSYSGKGKQVILVIDASKDHFAAPGNRVSEWRCSAMKEVKSRIVLSDCVWGKERRKEIKLP